MNKKLTLIIAAMLAALLLTACGTPASDPTAAPTATAKPYNPDDYVFDLPAAGTYDFGGQTFVISSYHAKYEQREDFTRTYALVDEIQSRYNCKIEWIYPDRQAEIDASALVGLPIADIGNNIMCHQIVPMVSSGIFASLDAYQDKIKFDDARWEESTKSIWRINGKQYGLSKKIQELHKYSSVDVMFANRDLLSSRGVDLDELYTLQENKEWTWSKFAEAAQKITCDINHDDIPDIYGCQASGMDWTTSFMVSAQSNYLKTDEDGKMIFDADQGVLDTLDFFRELVRTGASRASATGANSTTDFINGQLGFEIVIFQRTWQAGFLDQMSDRYGVLCVPLADGQTEYYLNDSMYVGCAIYNHQDKELEAKVADLFYLFGTCLFSSEEDEEECYWLEAENRIMDDGSRYFLDRVLEHTNTVVTRNYELLYNGLAFNETDVLLGNKTAEEYLQEITPLNNAFLQEYYNFTK